ncbi:DinB family protein [Alicyclobacillus curvatus]|jgi:uncharacterized damage-inducible protein DinB|nr:DinB family protein [Alicyclobacillus curvatus]
MQFTAKSVLLDQLGAIQDDPSWYVPLSVALDGLDASRADWKPGERDHSVREIMNHLVFWNERWLQHFNGKTRSNEIDNDATFTNLVQQSEPLDELEWKTLVSRLNTILFDWRKTLGECTEEQLREPVPNVKFNAPWWAVISNLVTHNVYHIGQIVYVRKLQGSWDDSKGF